jgi:hypothetical protein
MLHLYGEPDASTTTRGGVSTGAQSFGGLKTFAGGLVSGTVSGSAAASGSLTLQSTTDSTKGLIRFGSGGAYDEGNGRIGIGTQAPGFELHAFHAADSGTAQSSVVAQAHAATSSTNSCRFFGRRALGTLASPSAVTADTPLATFGGTGYTSAGAFSSNVSGRMTVCAAEGWSSTAQGAYLRFDTTPAGSTTPAERLRIDAAGNLVPQGAGLATNATDGFLYVESCAGAPTGTPTSYSNRCPVLLDRTNFKLYVNFGGTWKSVTLA